MKTSERYDEQQMDIYENMWTLYENRLNIYGANDKQTIYGNPKVMRVPLWDNTNLMATTWL